MICHAWSPISESLSMTTMRFTTASPSMSAVRRFGMSGRGMTDIDPIADRIAARLAGDSLRIWIVDEQGILDRNAVIACSPEKQLNARSGLNDILHGNL